MVCVYCLSGYDYMMSMVNCLYVQVELNLKHIGYIAISLKRISISAMLKCYTNRHMWFDSIWVRPRVVITNGFPIGNV